MRLWTNEAGQAGNRTPDPAGVVKRHKLDACMHIALHEGRLMATLDTAAQAEATLLEGCYVLETNVSQTALDASTVHDRYRDLHEVECRAEGEDFLG